MGLHIPQPGLKESREFKELRIVKKHIQNRAGLRTVLTSVYIRDRADTSLVPRAVDILFLLMETPGRVVRHEELYWSKRMKSPRAISAKQKHSVAETVGWLNDFLDDIGLDLLVASARTIGYVLCEFERKPPA